MYAVHLALVVALALLGCDAVTPSVAKSGQGTECDPRIGCETGPVPLDCVSFSCDEPGTCQVVPDAACERGASPVCDCRGVTRELACVPLGVPVSRGACEAGPLMPDIVVTPEPRCGDGMLSPTESCDDRNASSGDGCSAECQTEFGWTCPASIPRCGDGARSTFEECDDGNTIDSDGCAQDCKAEPGWQCTATGDCEPEECGDGIIHPFEECDDGNTLDGDGCSGICTELEPGWACRVPGRACAPECGDGTITATEECDDGNLQAGDGCNTSCHVEDDECDAGVCERAVCGDGLAEGPEACDDGGDNDDSAYGGCTTRCAFGPHCGDGSLDTVAGEECDLGDDNVALMYTTFSDVMDGDAGCTPACRFASYCGDGVVDPAYGETCDDGADNGISPCRVGCWFTVP